MARIKGETYEQYLNRVIKESVESFNRDSIKNQIDYIDYLIEVDRRPFVQRTYKWYLVFLKRVLNKTSQFDKLKVFYEKLGDIEKKEFQTELHVAMLKLCNERCYIDDDDKGLKDFYSLDNVDSKIEERKAIYITDPDLRKESGYDEKIISTFIDGCTPRVFEELQDSIKNFDLLMKNNLSSRTRKKLFSLPTYMRAYAYMEMYSTIRHNEFDESYLRDIYDTRKRLRDSKKQEEKEESKQTEKTYAKKRYPLIRPRI